jgi:Fe-S cluster biosynthesis and repair protein YggX
VRDCRNAFQKEIVFVSFQHASVRVKLLPVLIDENVRTPIGPKVRAFRDKKMEKFFFGGAVGEAEGACA